MASIIAQNCYSAAPLAGALVETLSSNGALFSSAGEGYDFGPCFALLGVRCVAGNKILSDNDIFSAVVVGR